MSPHAPLVRRARRAMLGAGMAVTLAATAIACTDNNAASGSSSKGGSSKGGSPRIDVESSDTACKLSATTAASGNIVFRVRNTGSQVTEFYLFRSDGVAIAGEVENIGPGLTRDLVVRPAAGTYVTSCKPGMTGDGIRSKFTVTASADASGTATKAELTQLETAAIDQYTAFVRQQADLLMTRTTEFADAVKAGNADVARSLYATARVPWESIEPVAESFGDLDPKLDLREADLEAGQTWTGWHRLEKDLWPPAGYTPLTDAERTTIADQLVADTKDLVTRVGSLKLTVDQLGNGAKELLDEVATGKVTGEEEAWSHTDLWDFQANIDGARIAYQALRPIVLVNDEALATTLDERFAAVQTALDAYRRGDGFMSYTELTADQVKALADTVDALSEPLSKLTATVLL